ncbi:inositol hexakisphosphate-domain-containing protein [Suillus subluteus]|nr:inositol hexakisphosphate-domain-containing protein [Suillus subluteus]
MRADGWNVEYHRIPISPDRPIEDNYLDAYLRVIKNTDPVRSALVFSCGMSAVRTTFAMVAAVIVRRKMLLARGSEDPYPSRSSFLSNLGSGSYKMGNGSPGISTPTNQAATDIKLAQALENRRTYHRGLISEITLSLADLHSQSVIALLMAQPTLLENLRKAHQGNYGVILSLFGCLDHGLQSKRLVDRVIDACDHVTNLREDVFTYRVKYSLTTADNDESKREDLLSKAQSALEKYYVITFASYVDSVDDFEMTLLDWLNARTVISVV